MEFFYVPIILLAVYLVFYYYFRRTFKYWKNKNVPGPTPLTFYGNFKDSILRRKNIGQVFEEIYKMHPNDKIVGIYRMTTPSLLIRDLDIIKYIMIKDFDKFMDRGLEFSKEGLGANLFSSDGDTWRALRSRFTPLFTTGKLKNMFYLMNNCAEKFMEMVNKETQINSEQEISNMIQRYTISSISACAFGVDYDSYNDSLDSFKKINSIILTPSFAKELDMLFPGILKNLGFSVFPKLVTNFFKDFVKNVITQRNGKPTKRNDFMDLILELKEQGKISTSKFGDDKMSLEITEDVITAQAFVFYFAGYETSATTMTYLLHELAMHPDVQEKLIAEIDMVLNANDNKITYDCLKEMKYLEKVFSETLRMHSIIEPLQRKAKVDYKVPGTDLVIEKGQLVFISPRAIHYDEKYYTRPEIFDPERFSAEEVGNRHPCAYLPFGIGSRNCIGMRFGQVQSKLCIVHLLSKYRVEPSKNSVKHLEVAPNRVIIGPEGGVYVNIVRRK